MRDGGDFTAGARCPACGLIGFHHLRAPNPTPPRLTHRGTGEVTEVRNAAGDVIVHDIDRDVYDRWDERDYNVVRMCDGCNHEWGQR